MQKHYLLEVSNLVTTTAIESRFENDIKNTISLYKKVLMKVSIIKNEQIRKYYLTKYAILSEKPKPLTKHEKIQLQILEAKHKAYNISKLLSECELSKIEKPSIKTVTDELSAAEYAVHNKAYHKNVSVVSSHIQKSHKELLDAIHSAKSSVQEIAKKRILYIPPSTKPSSKQKYCSNSTKVMYRQSEAIGTTKKKTLYIPPSSSYSNKANPATKEETLHTPPRKTTFVPPTKKELAEAVTSSCSQIHLTELIGDFNLLFSVAN